MKVDGKPFVFLGTPNVPAATFFKAVQKSSKVCQPLIDIKRNFFNDLGSSLLPHKASSFYQLALST